VSRRNGWTEARDRKRAGQAGTARRFVHFFRALFLFRQLPFHLFHFLLLLPLALVKGPHCGIGCLDEVSRRFSLVNVSLHPGNQTLQPRRYAPAGRRRLTFPM